MKTSEGVLGETIRFKGRENKVRKDRRYDTGRKEPSNQGKGQKWQVENSQGEMTSLAMDGLTHKGREGQARQQHVKLERNKLCVERPRQGMETQSRCRNFSWNEGRTGETREGRCRCDNQWVGNWKQGQAKQGKGKQVRHSCFERQLITFYF